MFPWQLLIPAPQVVPVIIELVRSPSRPSRRDSNRPCTQGISDLPRVVVLQKVCWDPPLKVVDAVLGERIRDRFVIRHVLRPRSFHKKTEGIQQVELEDGAQERTRTSTSIQTLAPEASASTNSATWAGVVSAGNTPGGKACQR